MRSRVSGVPAVALAVSFSSWLLLATMVGGCDGCGEHGAGVRDASHATVEPETSDDPDEPAALYSVRVVRGTGTANGERALHPGQPIERGELLEANAGSHLTFDLAREVHADLSGGARAIVGTATPAELILVSGMMRAQLPPEGSSARPPLWLGTPAGSVVISGTGDVFVAVLASGDVWVAPLGGLVRLSRGDAEGEGHTPVELDVRARRAVLLGRTSIGEPTEGPERLEAAEAAAQALSSAATPLEGEALMERLALLTARFDEAVGWLDAHSTLGRELDTAHRAAMASDPERGRAILGQIVAHGQQLIALKKIALTRHQQLVATAGFATSRGVTLDPDPVATRAERMRAMFPPR